MCYSSHFTGAGIVPLRAFFYIHILAKMCSSLMVRWCSHCCDQGIYCGLRHVNQWDASNEAVLIDGKPNVRKYSYQLLICSMWACPDKKTKKTRPVVFRFIFTNIILLWFTILIWCSRFYTVTPPISLHIGIDIAICIERQIPLKCNNSIVWGTTEHERDMYLRDGNISLTTGKGNVWFKSCSFDVFICIFWKVDVNLFRMMFNA